jgi:tRNA modification GTPase
VGKSSLLNRLAGSDVAIVTPIAGTTRDQVRATIHLDGVPIHLIDTAGLRETEDPVEQLGIGRTWSALESAGAVLVISEAGETIGPTESAIAARLSSNLPTLWIYNKIDVLGRPTNAATTDEALHISALTGEGVDAVRAWLLSAAGWQPTGEGVYMARSRHLAALSLAKTHLDAAVEVRSQFDLFAEELRLAQRALSSITGEFTADDLLGQIFSTFCIGK